MAESEEMIILGSKLAHRSEGDGAACRRKKRWWQINNDFCETQGYLICKERNNYSVKVHCNKSNFCYHDLPKPGWAIILRHNMETEGKSLFIANIVESSSSSKENPKSLFLSFSNVNDFSKWEQKLRDNLKVYSCNIEIDENQALPEGPASVHITSEYLYITANGNNQRYRSLFCRSMKKNKISISTNDSGKFHVIGIRNQNGISESIKFKSKDYSIIKRSIVFFSNSLPWGCGNKIRITSPSKATANKETVPVLKLGKRAEARQWYSHYDVLYAETETVRSVGRSTSSGMVKSGHPCIYNYVSHGLSSGGAQKTGQPQIAIADFNSNTEKRQDVASPLYGKGSENWDGAPDQPEGYVGKASGVDFDEKLKGTCKGTTIDTNGPSENSDKNCCDSDVFLPRDFVCRETGWSAVHGLLANEPDSPNKSNDYDHLKRFCDDRRISQLEDWTPKGLDHSPSSRSFSSETSPPIFKREFSGSLHPEDHVYKNIRLDSSNKMDIENKPIEILVLLFADGTTYDGLWSIGILVVKGQDQQTFKLVHDLENDVGRKQLCTPRSLDARSDITVNVKGCSEGFDVISEKSQILRYADLEKLGQMRWMVVEFQFEHQNEVSSVFKCDFSIVPAQEDSRKSHFSSQTISVIKKFSTSGSVETLHRQSTPPRSRLEMNALKRQEFCRDLDIAATLGNDWKEFAARIGLDTREIRIIEYSKCSSYTEEVLQILESRSPENCNIGYLKTVLLEMRRPDLMEYFE